MREREKMREREDEREKMIKQFFTLPSHYLRSKSSNSSNFDLESVVSFTTTEIAFNNWPQLVISAQAISDRHKYIK
jgi:hypothetical protein